ncbi:MAG: xanthine dehydrogenase family protein molybdopterin-binding subunit [Gammaproteobacteria bacterium]|nr:xanthine dehydrogenase family protein molybdopterin-binding subunit [Gammaproteobacteria bacterium]NIR98273.1 xanthine dehydrogenase family protein molybdopterin-binding subunit [Gammaproteobacteria bacterium]NIT63948.1 xanthine dehydrogenase family protein molybdopterin-binding subunit [Gammaproteobacteria bacterium]NIV20946.1 molybdopterin-dependent oxidoreductase [Gammaproteobacteria bacterium]NIX10237.1 molybdopterin-dependent oxidoreductase [Gammaproteobacteria bacterium]
MGRVRDGWSTLVRAIGGAWLFGVRAGDEPGGGETPGALNPWVRIDPDDTVTVIIDRSEMGQGVVTGLAMLVAEELEVDLDRVRTEFAPVAAVYNNRLFGEQMTGGSTSIRTAWEPLRHAGATARETLVQAAARVWDVPRTQCRAARGSVVHEPTGRRLRYGELVRRLGGDVPVVDEVTLKPPEAFRLLGHPARRLEIPEMVAGRTCYGADVCIPDMQVAVVARPPAIGARPGGFEEQAARAVPGVSAVVQIEAGVAVIADHFWAAVQGRDALRVQWDAGPYAGLEQAEIETRLERAADAANRTLQAWGNAGRALGRAGQVHEAAYRTAYLAHATLEPMNCTAWVREGRCDVWVGSQAQQGARDAAARAAGLPSARVNVHTTYLGGGFGRRLEQDFVTEAVALSRHTASPVQVMWTRQDDMQHDRYRPALCARLRAGIDADGLPVAWEQRIAGPGLVFNGIDLPYAIPNVQVLGREEDPGVPTGSWRSVGAGQHAFAIEGFIDELAHRAGRDPLTFRRDLLPKGSRQRAMLELAAEKAGWGHPCPSGRGRGIAAYHSFGTWVAQVTEASVDNGAIRAHRVVCAVDCGQTVNPDAVAAQMEGAVTMGLSAALGEAITVHQGRIQQSTFEDYPILTMAEMPVVEVHILPSREEPGGVGEPGVPPAAPALANALFAATGQRLRSLPLRPRGTPTSPANGH